MVYEENEAFQRVYSEKIWRIDEKTQERGRKITTKVILFFISQSNLLNFNYSKYFVTSFTRLGFNLVNWDTI